jgi:sacsin
VEANREFWLAIGLKRRLSGQFQVDDYISCLRAIRPRLEAFKDNTGDSALLKDIEEVLGPLTRPSTALDRFSQGDWSAVAEEATFPALMNFTHQPPHRTETMALLATAEPLLHLSETISHQCMPICWSQTSFPRFQPTTTTFANLPNDGNPSAHMVWQHLEHMADSVEELQKNSIPDFLSDLYATYNYLKDNMSEAKESFISRNRKIWLNIDLMTPQLVSKDALKSSWSGINNLILFSSCDAENLKYVKQALMPYENLLKALGCKTVHYPSAEAVEVYTSSLTSSLVELRRTGVLLDVTLETDDGDIRAHKLVLAAASEYFERQFSGRWSNTDTVHLRGEISHTTMSAVVDFAYRNKFDGASMRILEDDNAGAIADKLDDLLGLLTAADMFDMSVLLAEVESHILLYARSFIREENVLDVLDRARDANAHHVQRYCEKFYAANDESVALANQGGD